VVVAIVGAISVVSFASYATVGRRLVDDPQVRGARVHGVVQRADGRRMGTIDVKLVGAGVVWIGFDRLGNVHVFHAGRPGWTPTTMFPTQWFLQLGHTDDIVSGRLYIRPNVAHAGTLVRTLCAPCTGYDSGTLNLNPAEAAALIRDQLVFVAATKDDAHAMSAPLDFVRRRHP
jgi:hypothetical protein